MINFIAGIIVGIAGLTIWLFYQCNKDTIHNR